MDSTFIRLHIADELLMAPNLDQNANEQVYMGGSLFFDGDAPLLL
jgi:hypothetical protein